MCHCMDTLDLLPCTPGVLTKWYCPGGILLLHPADFLIINFDRIEIFQPGLLELHID